MSSACPHRDDTAAWTLGALPEPAAEHFAAHLHACADCRAQLGDFRLVVDSLAVCAPPMAPPPALKGRIMAVVEAEASLLQAAGAGADRPEPAKPRRRLFSLRPLPAAALASVLLALGLGGGALLAADPAPRVLTAEVDESAAPSGRATLSVDDDASKLRVAGLPQAPEDRVYQVWLKRPGQGPQATDALFTVNEHGRASVDVPGELDGVAEVLVTHEPRGGSSVPTRQPVVSATL